MHSNALRIDQHGSAHDANGRYAARRNDKHENVIEVAFGTDWSAPPSNVRAFPVRRQVRPTRIPGAPGSPTPLRLEAMELLSAEDLASPGRIMDVLRRQGVPEAELPARLGAVMRELTKAGQI